MQYNIPLDCELLEANITSASPSKAHTPLVVPSTASAQ